NRSANVSRIGGHSASPSVPCRYINGTPLPARARLSLQPLISIVRRTNSMVHPRVPVHPSRKGRGGRQPAQPFSKCCAVASPGCAELRGFDEQAAAFTSVADYCEGLEWLGRCSPPEFI